MGLYLEVLETGQNTLKVSGVVLVTAMNTESAIVSNSGSTTFPCGFKAESLRSLVLAGARVPGKVFR